MSATPLKRWKQTSKETGLVYAYNRVIQGGEHGVVRKWYGISFTPAVRRSMKQIANEPQYDNK